MQGQLLGLNRLYPAHRGLAEDVSRGCVHPETVSFPLFQKVAIKQKDEGLGKYK